MLKGFDLRGWSCNGSKLAPPWVILWRIIWWVPFKVFLVLACLSAWLGFGRYAAEQLWDAGK